MEYVTSADGVQIAYQRSGTGPPLILVHGGLSDHSRWDPLTEHIRDHFTVYAVDRRGRGGSGDAEEYSFEHEVDDVVAVANSIDGPVNLYGHSGGGTYALEAAPRINCLRRLVLYESYAPSGAGYLPSAVIDKIENLLDEGKREEALITALRDIVQMPPQEIEQYRSSPSWPGRVAAAHTFVRELRTGHEYRLVPARFNDLQVPTLLLVGGDSPVEFKASIETVNDALPNSRVHELPGQRHGADITAPEMVASALIEFLREEER